MGIFSNIVRDFKEGVSAIKEGASAVKEGVKSQFVKNITTEQEIPIKREAIKAVLPTPLKPVVDTVVQSKKINLKEPTTKGGVFGSLVRMVPGSLARETIRTGLELSPETQLARMEGRPEPKIVPQTELQKALIGEEEITPLGSGLVARKTREFLQRRGASEESATQTGLFASVALGLTLENPIFGGGKKAVAKEAIEESTERIGKIIAVSDGADEAAAYVKELVQKQKDAGSGGKKTLFNRAKDFYKEVKSKIIDSNSPIEDVLAESQKKGNYEILPEKNITNQIDRVLRSPTMAGQFAKDNGLVDVIKQVDDLNNLDQYLIAKQARDAASYGIETGRDLAKDEILIKAFEPKYGEYAKRVNDYSRALLSKAVNDGLIEKEAAEYLIERYPNYVPMERIFTEAEQEAMERGGASASGFGNLSKQTVVRRLEGSEREISSPIEALLKKTYDVFSQGERNRGGIIFSSYYNLPENPFGLKPLRTAAQVKERRAAAQELTVLKSEYERIRTSLGDINKADTQLVSKMNQLQKEINDLSEEAIETFLEKEPEEAKQLIEEIRIKEDARAKEGAIKRAEKESELQSLVLDTKKKERVRVLNQDISKLEKELENAAAKYEAKRVAIADGSLESVAKEMNDLDRAQKRLETALQEKELVIGSDTKVDIKPKDIPIKTTVSSKNVGPTTKQSIEQQIVKRHDDIELLKSRIASREAKLAAAEQAKLGTEAQLDMLYQNFNAKKIQIKKVFDQMRSLADGKAGVTEKSNVITFFRDGIQERWLVESEFADAIKNMSEQQLGLLGQLFALPTRILKLGTTGINFPFTVANLVKDQLTAFINSEKSLKTSLANPVNFLQSLSAAVKHNDLYEEMVRNAGGGTSFDIARNQVAKTVEGIRSSRSIGKRAKYLATSPRQLLRAVEDIFARTEELTRIQQYNGIKQALLKEGRTLKDAEILAAKAARETTANFSRRGSWGKVVNATIPYFNAGIQGSRAFLRAAARDPKGTAIKVVGGLYVPLTAATIWNLASEDRKAAYADIAEYEKEGNIIIVPPNPTKDEDGKWNVIEIPLPAGISALTIPVRKTFETMEGIDKISMIDFLEAITGPVDPFGVDFERPSSLLSNITPQVIKPALQAYTNKNFFTGFKQVPSNMENLSPELQVKPETSGTAKAVGRALNVSPIKVDAFAKDTAGDLARLTTNITDRALAGLGVIPETDVRTKSSFDALRDRFGKARGGEVEDKELQEIYDIKKKEGDMRFLTKQEAELIHQEMKTLPPAQANEKMKELKKTNKPLYEKVKDIVSDEKMGLTQADRLIKSLGVENGVRAEYIHKKVSQLKTSEEKNAYIKELRRKKIVTKEVTKQLQELAKKDSL